MVQELAGDNINSAQGANACANLRQRRGVSQGNAADVSFHNHREYTGEVLLPLIELKGFLTPILHFRIRIHQEDR